MLYFQWFKMVKDLPITWMPNPLSQGWESMAKVFGVIFGSVASLDCLFQAWGWWQTPTVRDIVTNVFMRSFIR